MASGGTENSTHVTGELFKIMAGVDLLHVPYRGSPPSHGWRRRLLLDERPVQLAEIAVAEEPNDQVRRDLAPRSPGQSGVRTRTLAVDRRPRAKP
jgi:hypothetical protein